MKMRKAYTILLAAAMCLSLLCISAAAAAKDDAGDSNSEDIIKSETLGVVVVNGVGKYDFGDGTTVTIEPIPWLMDEDLKEPVFFEDGTILYCTVIDE